MATQSPPPILKRPSPLLNLKVGKLSDAKLDESQAVSPIRSAKSVQPRVFARLQALFPPSISSPRSLPAQSRSPTSVTSPLLQVPPASPQFIKTRIITWNMHDSLPKGDLEELLGSVPLHTPRSALDDADRMRIPGLSTDEGHPYHIIVVAGQECPTLSGIPMGLGAIKYKDAREREKDKEKHKDKDSEKDSEKERSKEKDLLYHTKSILSKHLKHEHPSHPRTPDTPQSDAGQDASSIHSSTPTSGWSAVLEDWFANGACSLHDIRPVVTATLNSPAVPVSAPHESNGDSHVALDPPKTPWISSDHQQPQTLDVSWKPYNASATGSDTPPASTLQAKTGPYELLTKERLMGIYTAVYVHRDVRSLVRGVSSGVVPAGLIGGRLGNKGGVGVSVDLHGTTFLFINAHLAAHEGKVPLRVANLAKIKAELTVESFLSNDDPRTFAEDLSDRFDHTWIFGDLNFRLDISRLHADWLISHKEYAQAFEFDQLQKLMKDGEPTLAGFHEAKIDFPPTFKYDVLRTLKRDKHKPPKDQNASRCTLDGVEERDGEVRVGEPGQECEDDEEGRGGLASSRSSIWTSNQTKDRTDITEDGDQSDPSPTHSTPVTPNSGLIGSPAAKLATHAKATWLALLKTSRDPLSLPPHKRRRTSAARLGVPGSSIELSRGLRTPNASTSSLHPQVLRRVASAKASLIQHNQDDLLPVVDDKGVYDSSSKKRVPSWCDRILWKTTVKPTNDTEPKPGLETDQDNTPPPSRGRGTRVSQLFQVFRARDRRNSNFPDRSSSPLSALTPSDNATTKLLSFSRFSQSSHNASVTTSPGLYQSKSLEPPPTLSIIHAESMSPLVKRKRSASATVARDRSASGQQSLPAISRPSRALSSPRRAESDQLTSKFQPDVAQPPATLVTPSTRAGPKRWFLNLVSRDHPTSSPPSMTSGAPQAFPPPMPEHRKGDVVCLSYRTLDDRQMRRLEGRSDHRPVIGTFAIHV